MKLHLVRHGETEWNREGRIQGWIDVGLNDNGVNQARRTAGKLAGDGPFDLISSSLRRARETALILEDHLNLRDLRYREEFRELNQGFWNGLRGEWLVETEHPKFLEWIRNPIKSSPPGGEDLLSVRERVSKALDDILRRAEFPVIIVAHKVVNSLIAHLFGCWEIDEVMDSLPENASVFELELNEEDLTSILEAG